MSNFNCFHFRLLCGESGTCTSTASLLPTMTIWRTPWLRMAMTDLTDLVGPEVASMTSRLPPRSSFRYYCDVLWYSSQFSDLSKSLNASQFFLFRCELLVLIIVLCLFQVKKSAKSLQDPVSKNKKPLFQDIPKNLQKPLQDDEPFRTRAATNPSSPTAGILLFSPDSPNFFPIISLYYVLF